MSELNLFCNNDFGNQVHYRVNPEQKFSQLIKSFSDRCQKDPEQMKFLINDRILTNSDAQQTYMELGLKDGDRLNAI